MNGTAQETTTITAADICWELAPPPAPNLPMEDDVPALIERIVDLTAERDTYRALADQTIHALHHVTLERDLLRQQRRLDRAQPARKAAA